LEFVGIDSREFIWDTFRPLLAGIDDERGVDREVFSVKSSDHDVLLFKTVTLIRADLAVSSSYKKARINNRFWSSSRIRKLINVSHPATNPY